VAWDGGDGWYVSDAAANAVLHVDAAGRIRTVAVVASMAPLGGRAAQGVPTGLARAADGTLYVALFGGARRRRPGGGGHPARRPGRRPPQPAHGSGPGHRPDRRDPNPAGTAVLDYSGGPGGRDRGRILRVAGPAGPGRVLASGLDRPVGMAQLPDGRYLVAETDSGCLRLVTPR
jgi:sugar lactone lactonase YvrE